MLGRCWVALRYLIRRCTTGAASANSVLHSNTAVENLLVFLMAVDDDGDYGNGIQTAPTVRLAKR